jgi:putative ABC transport system permease protein
MAIPISYNIRNLAVRKTTTIMTALGIGLTVAVLLAILALVNGLRTAFEATGNPVYVLVLRKGADSELISAVSRDEFRTIKTKAGIAVDPHGDPMASAEGILVINLPSVDNPDGSNITLRGTSAIGIEMRDNVKIAEGRWFERGHREVVAGKAIAARFPGARIGQKVRFGRGEWTVVGILDAGRGAPNSEIWGSWDEIAADFGRELGSSSVLVRAKDEVAAAALINDINSDQRTTTQAMRETDYYAAQTSSGLLVEFLGLFISVIMAVGSGFAAANTMYAAVARRAKEIGTLRVLGFSRGSILLSFLAESLALAAVGGAVGCLLVLPLNGVSTGIANSVTFSEVAFDFRISPQIMATGVAFALVLGAIGGVFPARSAAKKEILTALREI